MEYFRNVYSGRYILMSLVKKDFVNKYRKTTLGIAWSLISPLGLVLIIGTVFALVLDRPFKSFIPFVFSGLMPWIFISSCAQSGTNAFLAAQGYIKQTRTPIEIFPLRVALGEYFTLLFSLSAYFIIYAFISPENFSVKMLLVIPALLVWALFGMAIATISGICNTYVRDYAPLQSLLIQGLFYVTPITWTPDILGDKGLSIIYSVNPIYYMMDILRGTLLGTSEINLESWLIAILTTCILCFIAIYMMSKIKRRIVFKL